MDRKPEIKVEIFKQTDKNKLLNYKGEKTFKNVTQEQWQEFFEKHDGN